MAGRGSIVLPGRKADQPLSNMALLMLLRRMGRGELTAHGFCACFKTWATEQTEFPNELIEIALAHSVGSKTEAAYWRGELLQKRRELAEAWARHCTTSPAKVVRFGKPGA